MSEEKSIDPAVKMVLDDASNDGIQTVFDRAEEVKPCPIGAGGSCCRICAMGPCRITGKNAEDKTGVCGATLSTIAARNLARSIAAGTAAHSDHGRDLAFALLGVAKGEIKDYSIKDEAKLIAVAKDLGIEVDGMDAMKIAEQVALKAIENFGQQKGELSYLKRAPEKRQKIWRDLSISPRGIDREVVEMMHRTNMGVDQDADNILLQSMRTALADGWGGAMLATDISDILFGTPEPLVSNVNLGVLKADHVNVVVHGHEPLLSEMIVAAASDSELIDLAKKQGAEGINLAGICCTANEILMRHGITPAGNFLQQELAIMTGAVDAMVVDVQCVMQALAKVAESYHTKLITTSRKAKMDGAIHMEFDQYHAMEIAKNIVKTAIDNFSNRKASAVNIPDVSNPMIAGFSHEYIRYMLGGRFRASFRPLNDAIISGRIKGAVGVVGCNNPRTAHDKSHEYIVKELIKNDVLVVQTGCGAIASAKYGLLTPEAMEMAGPGLREICETVGIPPVLHLGSCVDNTRILTVLCELVSEGGLGDDLSQLPAVGIAPEWMSEKALAIGTYFVASGAYVIFGVTSPVSASEEVSTIISEGWESKTGGKLEFVIDPADIVEKTLAHLDQKRKELGIDVKKERELFDMAKRRELNV